MKPALALVFLLLLNACITTNVPENLKFTAESEDSFLVLGSAHFAPRGLSTTNWVGLASIDMQNGKFLDDYISIVDCDACIASGKSTYDFPNNYSLSTYRMLSLKPGHYAVVSERTSRDIGFTRRININCFSDGMPVFEVKPGTVNVFHTLGSASDETVSFVQGSLNRNEQITAPVKLSKIQAIVQVNGFDCKNSILNKKFNIIRAYQ